MISWKKHLLPFAISGAALMMVSCSDYTGKEKTHPVFMRAENAKMSGNYRDASKDFEEFLLICPKSGRTHYELASIYADYLEDPILAIYHYTRYSELAGSDSASMEDVRSFIEVSRRKAYEKLKVEFGRSDDSEGLKRELAQTQANLKKVITVYEEVMAQNKEMREIIQKEIDRRTGGAASTTSAPTGTTSTTSTSPGTTSTATGTGTAPTTSVTPPAPAPVTSGTEAGTRTYTVKEGDTLAKISRLFYQDGTFYPVILNANKDLLGGNPDKLRVGMVLKIPQKPQTTR